MGKKPDPGSGMNIPDNFSESLETVFCVKNTNSLIRIREVFNAGSGIWDGENRIRDPR
jgi:hypothetical protein